jgi:Xaa-Pro aminopeptidase
MQSGFAKGQFAVDWEERFDLPRLRRDRVAKARAELAASDFDALLMWKDENVRYLSSLRPQIIAGKSTSLNGVVLASEGDPVLLCSGGELDKARAGMPWISEIHAIPIMEQQELVDGFVKETLTPVLAARDLLSARIGIDQSNYSLIEAMKRHLPNVELGDGDTVMLRARLIKLDAEVAILEEACAIADAVVHRAIEACRVGRRELEVAGDAMQTLYHLGGELPHVLTPFVASGEHMSPPHRISTDKIIRNGDLVFIDIGAMWNGYYGDIARCTVVGKPSQEQKKIYTAVYEGLMAGVAEMRPGRTNKDMADALLAKIGEYGLRGHEFSLFIGHGIGIGANEPPYLGETLPGATTYEFQPGMVFAVEPLVWVPGIRGGGGVRIEDMVLVTETGPRILSRAEYEERLLL